MEKSKGCTSLETFYYKDKDGVTKEVLPGRRLTIYCHYNNGTTVLRLGNKLFIGKTDLIIEDK